MIEIEETVLLICEGKCISISKNILTAFSTLYAAKLSDRWNKTGIQKGYHHTKFEIDRTNFTCQN